ncbi:erythromycin esterase family protein [Nocardia sp. NPDC006630]|uniref:erythromycin esterase family protein n=1 Tax=Nocardia sp. NPDC006630 TaxID=3157181 RepID=UPI0033B1CA73
MSQHIQDFVTSSSELLALGEPTHQVPAFGWVRNELFVQLVELGFRSIGLETDRVAALAVNDFVQNGLGDLDTVMREGFSHDFGALETNRQLVAWMREYNRSRTPAAHLTFYGIDAQTENTSAPSPRRYLEYARDYLGLDIDIASAAGDDEQWGREEAILDPEMSMGESEAAGRLRSIADDLVDALYECAPQRIAATSRTEWQRAETYLAAGIGLLRYHRVAAQRRELNERIALLLGARDVIMAQNLLAIRRIESRRGPTLVFANNTHLQRNPSHFSRADSDITWTGAGSIASSLMGDQYSFIAGSLGRHDHFGLHEPEPDTSEAFLDNRISTWGLIASSAVAAARSRTDTTPQQGYFPLDAATLDGADAVLHISDGAAIRPESIRTPRG